MFKYNEAGAMWAEGPKKVSGGVQEENNLREG